MGEYKTILSAYTVHVYYEALRIVLGSPFNAKLQLLDF